VAARVARGECEKVAITPEQVPEILGPERYIRETRLKTARPGVVTGLAFTPRVAKSSISKQPAILVAAM